MLSVQFGAVHQLIRSLYLRFYVEIRNILYFIQKVRLFVKKYLTK